MSEKGVTGKPFTGGDSPDLGEMGKAELLEVQWQVGDQSSLDTAAEVEPERQHLVEARDVNFSCSERGQ